MLTSVGSDVKVVWWFGSACIFLGAAVGRWLALRPTQSRAWQAQWVTAASGEPAVRARLQFITGLDELTVPDVKLTRSRDGTNGKAILRFEKPSVFDAVNELGQITGLYMVDGEGTISTTQVTGRFVNGVPASLEASYVMRSTEEWDRFMRFMERYAEANGMGFNKA